jgi:glycosyltransferase involved in cell wall biosynthesis
VRILLVSSGSGSRGGGEIFLYYLAQGLVARGHEVLIWIPAHPRMDELADKIATVAKVIRADYRNTYDYQLRTVATAFNYGVSQEIAETWRELQPDVIHLNKQNLEDGLDLLRAANYSSAPTTCTIHLTQTARYLRAQAAWVRDWIAQRALRQYRGVFVAVQKTRHKALKDFLGENVRSMTILNGVPLPDLSQKRVQRAAKRQELGFNDREFVILGVGRLVAQKRPLLFLELAKEVHERFALARFVWVGDGKLGREWDQWVAANRLEGIASRVEWQEDTTPLLFAGDLLLHVAEFEGLPLALIEAMAAELPCAVTRDFAGEIEFLTNENVLLLDNAATLATQLSDNESLRRVAHNGRLLVEQRLSLAKMVNAYEQLYTELAKK